MAEDDFVTLREAAELLGITRQHMRRKALEYGLESYFRPADRRVRLFRRADVLGLAQPRAYPKTRAA